MELSQEQYQQLKLFLVSKKPNWEIQVGFLMTKCGLNFQEASRVKHQMEKEIYEENLRQKPESNKISSGQESEEKRVIEIKETQESTPVVSPSIEEKSKLCITCGKEDLNCSCKVKLIQEIPF